LKIAMIKKINSFLCRFCSSRELEARAKEFRDSYRRLDLSTTNTSTENEDCKYQFCTLWPNSLEKDFRKISLELQGNRYYTGANRDQCALRATYNRLNEGDLRLFSKFDIFDHLPGSSLIDHLIVSRQEAHGSFSLPTMEYLRAIQRTRTVSHVTARSSHQFFELTTGVSTLQEIDSAVDLFWTLWKRDQDRAPTGTISMDVEEICITKESKNNLPSTCKNKAIEVNQPPPGVKACQQPVRLILGGLDWTLSIRIDIRTHDPKADQKCYLITSSYLQDNLAQFMENLPTATGCRVREDMENWSGYMRTLGHSDFKFRKGFIELPTLAALAGFHSHRCTMFNMNLQVLGGLLPKNNSCADNLWSLPVESLPDEFKTYIIGDTRMAHHCYVVLSAVLLDQLFPDPELACYLTKVNQKRFCQWWSDFLRATLINQEVDFTAYKDARNRVDLCAAIRLREPSLAARVTQGLDLDPLTSSPGLAPAEDDSFDIFADNGCVPGKLRPNPQTRTIQFSELIPPFPSLVYGGPRYLHSARTFLLKQIETLSVHQLFCVDNIWKDITMTKELEDYATFGQQVSMGNIHLPTISPFLVADPDLEVMFFFSSHWSQQPYFTVRKGV
jgi:hypothetical protein